MCLYTEWGRNLWSQVLSGEGASISDARFLPGMVEYSGGISKGEYSEWVPRGRYVHGMSTQKEWILGGTQELITQGVITQRVIVQRVSTQGWVPSGWVLRGVSIQEVVGTDPHYWHLVAATITYVYIYMWLASRQYIFYWNAFLWCVIMFWRISFRFVLKYMCKRWFS